MHRTSRICAMRFIFCKNEKDYVILGKETKRTIDLPTKNRKYIAIDLKSFYASVECVERGLDPLDACLVVADASRTEKTIVLAVSPALKSFGLGGRPRLFERCIGRSHCCVHD